VPEENLLGPEHEGFSLIMANFQWERLLMALGAVAAMQVALERTLDFTRSAGVRQAADRPPGDPPQLVDVATTVHTCRCLTYDALRALRRRARSRSSR
jgi:acyl-CoA dehydrogenase